MLTELFVDLRNFITVPQQEAWDFLQSLLDGGTAPEASATVFRDGLQSIGTAMAQFSDSVISDIISAPGSGTDVSG